MAPITKLLIIAAMLVALEITSRKLNSLAFKFADSPAYLARQTAINTLHRPPMMVNQTEKLTVCVDGFTEVRVVSIEVSGEKRASFCSYMHSVNVRTQRRETYRCGWFLWRRTCTRTVTYYAPVWRSGRHCCKGWTGSDCKTEATTAAPVVRPVPRPGHITGTDCKTEATTATPVVRPVPRPGHIGKWKPGQQIP
ncbi:hypothetical protein CAPTEDRAFT_188031 [Capitella teleta]|uniref:EMI domain-containing protein n=1 Tax=Capitella teleta TaxID=283909 RepID=R7T777_CAPTE|nr:hypothetical protein CAPTEDRAFT_188031 [Capitella teleta]|eukprot:ELT89445.1 hypothetical protein CAPTEDRAFT_188031 [Capitella teleta]